MTGANPRPPAISRRLLEWAADRLGAPELADDAAEVFAERADRGGERQARRWYRRQARASLISVLLARSRRVRTHPGVALSHGFGLDTKLGLRMLARYPGLTAVAVLGMAFAILIGAGTFEFISQNFPSAYPDRRLPLPEGHRVVGLRYWDRALDQPEFPVAEDFRVWREALETVEHLGAYQEMERSLTVGEQSGDPMEVARMTAAGFRIPKVAPVLGRVLTEADEQPGAPDVVVIGHRIWQTRFAGDSSVVGGTVRVGGIQMTVIGVMPEGFAFPRTHSLWTPLRLAELDSGSGESLRVFGRLAPGATLDEAQAELVAVAAFAARESPERHAQLIAQVLPYRQSLFSLRIGPLVRAIIYQLNVYPFLFLILVSANVALLMFARATTREREILVRSALGASRRRIATQFFIEALVLGTVAAALGLGATRPALGFLRAELGSLGGGDVPFWFTAAISPTTAAYAALLTLVGASVAGVVPALKVTGPSLQPRLRQTSARAGGLRLGGVWTVVIVAQIAATVAFTGTAYLVTRQAVRTAVVESNFAAEQYIAARLEVDGRTSAQANDTTLGALERQYEGFVREFKRRMSNAAGAVGVTVFDQLPVKSWPSGSIQVDEGGAAALEQGQPGYLVSAARVDLDFFRVYRAPIVAGRGFDSRDLEPGSTAIVVDELFVRQVLGERSALGRRIRFLDPARPDEPGPWHEIVGVVRDLVTDAPSSLDLERPPLAHVYQPLDLQRAATYPLRIAVHVPSGPESLTSMLHRAAAAVSPSLRLHEVGTLDRATATDAKFWQLWADLVGLVSAIALLLSLAGIYAVMSFTVSRRRREIGLRVALGARAARVVAEVFRKPLIHVGTGVLAGSLILGIVVWFLTAGRVVAGEVALVVAFGACMLGVCALACIGPTLRALRVQPTEALSAEM